MCIWNITFYTCGCMTYRNNPNPSQNSNKNPPPDFCPSYLTTHHHNHQNPLPTTTTISYTTNPPPTLPPTTSGGHKHIHFSTLHQWSTTYRACANYNPCFAYQDAITCPIHKHYRDIKTNSVPQKNQINTTHHLAEMRRTCKTAEAARNVIENDSRRSVIGGYHERTKIELAERAVQLEKLCEIAKVLARMWGVGREGRTGEGEGEGGDWEEIKWAYKSEKYLRTLREDREAPSQFRRKVRERAGSLWR